MNIDIPLPEQDSPYVVAGIYSLVIREFGRQLSKKVHERFVAANAGDWFQLLSAARARDKYRTFDDPKDPRFLLKEAVIVDSPVRDAIPGFDEEWFQNGRNLKRQVDSWQHFSTEPTLINLEKFLEKLAILSSKSELAILSTVNRLLARVKAILEGKYLVKVDGGPQVTLDQEAQEFAKQIQKKSDEIIARPPIGAEWLGEEGIRKIKINIQLQDVLENGVSIRNELGPDAEEKIANWLRYYPNGGEARIASDGAVMGYKKGTKYLIGWLGKEPKKTTPGPEGFNLPHEFEFMDGDIRDIKTKQLLSEVAAEPVSALLNQVISAVDPGAQLNVTNYGEVVYETDSGEYKTIARVHKDNWFPGQLPG